MLATRLRFGWCLNDTVVSFLNCWYLAPIASRLSLEVIQFSWRYDAFCDLRFVTLNPWAFFACRLVSSALYFACALTILRKPHTAGFISMAVVTFGPTALPSVEHEGLRMGRGVPSSHFRLPAPFYVEYPLPQSPQRQ